MTEVLAAEWTARVEETFQALRWADRDVQEQACQSIEKDRGGEEAGRKLRELFEAEADRMRASFILPKAQPSIENPKVERPSVEEPKSKPEPKIEIVKPKAVVGDLKARALRILAAREGVVVVLKPRQQEKPEPEPEPEPEREERREAPIIAEVARVRGSRQGLAPGLMGEIADFTVGSAMYPSVKFAVAGSLVLIGALIGRRIAGPSGALGTGTHLYLVIAGPTGSGKEHLRTVTKLLLTSVGAAALIGPGRFKSGAGIISHLVKKPVSLCVMDEFGAMLGRITGPKAQFYQLDETEILRELWGISFSRYDSPEGASSDSEAVLSPALSIIGMSTPKELYKACRSRDATNGFLNRWLFVEEKSVPEYQRVGPEALNVPKELKEALSRLYQPDAGLLDQTSQGFKPSFRMGWGPGAEEIYDGIRQGIEREGDERRRELFWRSAEKTVRIATIIAAGCLSKTVNRNHMEWANEFVTGCDETLLAGVQEYMEEEKLEFGELCRELIRRVRQCGGQMSSRDIGRSFQNNLKFGPPELKRAVDHLVETEQLIEGKVETGGRPSIVYRLPPRERPKK